MVKLSPGKAACALCVLFSLCHFPRPLAAQSSINTTMESLDSAINGRLYTDTYLGVSGHPFYRDRTWKSGWVSMFGTLYYSERLNIDLASDDLLCLMNSAQHGSRVIRMCKVCIDSFQVDQSVFIPFRETPNQAEAGFYKVIYRGRSTFLKKNRKELVKSGADPRGCFWKGCITSGKKKGKPCAFGPRANCCETWGRSERPSKASSKPSKSIPGRQFNACCPN
ncbi:MAG: hypothetical protein HC842_06710 [Cytophagales bacterium]|nr:hypothetical protein [Cytophagales bacterium]